MARSSASGIQPSEEPGALPELPKASSRQYIEDTARQYIAYLVVGAYLSVLGFTVIPVALYIVLTQDLEPGEVKELLITMTTVVSGVAGVLGFVLGYYFKAVESGSIAPRTRTTRKRAAPGE